MFIEIDYSTHDLLPLDRKSIADIVTQANYQLEAGDLYSLYLTVDTHRTNLHRDSIRVEYAAFEEAIRVAEADGDAPAVRALRAMQKSRRVHGELVEEYGRQLEDLIGGPETALA